MTTTAESSIVGRSRACKMVVGIDSVLYDRHDRNMTILVRLVQDNIDRVNNIFAQQVLDKESHLSDVYFHVARVQVMFGTCDNFEDHNCTHYCEQYLKHFDRGDFADFCLAYMFTHIDFDNGTAGLAHIGSVCRRDQNTGFVTTLNHGEEKDLDSTVATLAHEIGHNFGAKHDNDLGEADAAECKGQGFLMNDVLENGPEHAANRMKFSPCSIRDMKAETLSKIGTPDIPDCFVSLAYDPKSEPVKTICGNGILEEGEQCDCGLTIEHCNDACYPGVITPSERRANESALPCSRNQRHDCLHPPGLVFGIYVPFAVIFVVIIIVGVALVRDWRRGKACFTHVTNGSVRIVR